MPDGDIVGDHYNCACPHCGKCNHYVTQGIELAIGKAKIFSKPCTHCQKEIFYQGQYEIKVVASTEHPIDRLRN